MSDRRRQAEEEATIRGIVDGMAWPDDVNGYDVEFGEDWEGDPAVYVWLVVDDDLRPSDAKLQRVGNFKHKVARALIDSDLSHWPFVQIRAVQPSRV